MSDVIFQPFYYKKRTTIAEKDTKLKDEIRGCIPEIKTLTLVDGNAN